MAREETAGDYGRGIRWSHGGCADGADDATDIVFPGAGAHQPMTRSQKVSTAGAGPAGRVPSTM